MKYGDELGIIRQYTSKAELDKAFHVLEGLLQGINIDGEITLSEITELLAWCDYHNELVNKQPFKQIIPMIRTACDDQVITESELSDLKWFIRQLMTPNEYYDVITSDMQKLHGLLHGILADNVIDDKEIILLKKWLLENEHLVGVYPFDELESVVIGILEDGIITQAERNFLIAFISDFIDMQTTKNINIDEIERLKKECCMQGVCTINPDISFNNKLFCFSGVSEKMKRKDIATTIEQKGGKYNDTVINETNYLIVADGGNPCWAYSCYGRKVEKAVNLRKKGIKISIVNEVDFWDSLVE